MKFAAIDIGSNAVRLLFCDVIEDNEGPIFKKAELIRVPLRLGEDAFLKGRISEKKIEKLVTAMKAFKHLIDVYEALDWRACATSAMREAENGLEIIERVKKETGMQIEIVDGKTEADIIYCNHIAEHLDKKHSYLYIDVGGGSTEISLFSNGKNIGSQSFNIGTIRILHNQISKDYWSYYKTWIREITTGHKPLIAIGSGGNINKLFKMSGKKENKSLSYTRLKSMAEILESYPLEDRIKVFGLKPDRADVIVPAAKIVLSTMKAGNIERILVPEIGLSDGIVHLLYEKHKQGKATVINQLSLK